MTNPIRDEAQRELGQVGKAENSQVGFSFAEGHAVNGSGLNESPADLFPESLPAYRPTAGASAETAPQSRPIVTGQCAQVMGLIQQHQPLLSLEMTANHAIPEAAARVHDLRAMGFNIITTIKSEVEFRGAIRRNVALYSIGSPAWPRPGFLDGSAS